MPPTLDADSALASAPQAQEAPAAVVAAPAAPQLPPLPTTSLPGVALPPGQPPVVGARVTVYWRKQDEWFEGMVRAVDEQLAKKGKIGYEVRIEYDDGHTSVHPLEETRLQVLNAPNLPTADNNMPPQVANSEDQKPSAAAKAASAARQEAAKQAAAAARQVAAQEAAEAAAKAADKKARMKATKAAKAASAAKTAEAQAAGGLPVAASSGSAAGGGSSTAETKAASEAAVAAAYAKYAEVPKTAAEVKAGLLTVGGRVLISGLTERPELNNTYATTLSFDPAKGRYMLRLATNAKVLLKPTHVSDAPVMAAVPPPPVAVAPAACSAESIIAAAMSAAGGLAAGKVAFGSGGAQAGAAQRAGAEAKSRSRAGGGGSRGRKAPLSPSAGDAPPPPLTPFLEPVLPVGVPPLSAAGQSACMVAWQFVHTFLPPSGAHAAMIAHDSPPATTITAASAAATATANAAATASTAATATASAAATATADNGNGDTIGTAEQDGGGEVAHVGLGTWPHLGGARWDLDGSRLLPPSLEQLAIALAAPPAPPPPVPPPSTEAGPAADKPAADANGDAAPTPTPPLPLTDVLHLTLLRALLPDEVDPLTPPSGWRFEKRARLSSALDKMLGATTVRPAPARPPALPSPANGTAVAAPAGARDAAPDAAPAAASSSPSNAPASAPLPNAPTFQYGPGIITPALCDALPLLSAEIWPELLRLLLAHWLEGDSDSPAAAAAALGAPSTKRANAAGGAAGGGSSARDDASDPLALLAVGLETLEYHQLPADLRMAALEHLCEAALALDETGAGGAEKELSERRRQARDAVREAREAAHQAVVEEERRVAAVEKAKADKEKAAKDKEAKERRAAEKAAKRKAEEELRANRIGRNRPRRGGVSYGEGEEEDGKAEVESKVEEVKEEEEGKVVEESMEASAMEVDGKEGGDEHGVKTEEMAKAESKHEDTPAAAAAEGSVSSAAGGATAQTPPAAACDAPGAASNSDGAIKAAEDDGECRGGGAATATAPAPIVPAAPTADEVAANKLLQLRVRCECLGADREASRYWVLPYWAAQTAAPATAGPAIKEASNARARAKKPEPPKRGALGSAIPGQMPPLGAASMASALPGSAPSMLLASTGGAPVNFASGSAGSVAGLLSTSNPSGQRRQGDPRDLLDPSALAAAAAAAGSAIVAPASEEAEAMQAAATASKSHGHTAQAAEEEAAAAQIVHAQLAAARMPSHLHTAAWHASVLNAVNPVAAPGAVPVVGPVVAPAAVPGAAPPGMVPVLPPGVMPVMVPMMPIAPPHVASLAATPTLVQPTVAPLAPPLAAPTVTPLAAPLAAAPPMQPVMLDAVPFMAPAAPAANLLAVETPAAAHAPAPAEAWPPKMVLSYRLFVEAKSGSWSMARPSALLQLRAALRKSTARADANLLIKLVAAMEPGGRLDTRMPAGVFSSTAVAAAAAAAAKPASVAAPAADASSALVPSTASLPAAYASAATAASVDRVRQAITNLEDELIGEICDGDAEQWSAAWASLHADSTAAAESAADALEDERADGANADADVDVDMGAALTEAQRREVYKRAMVLRALGRAAKEDIHGWQIEIKMRADGIQRDLHATSTAGKVCRTAPALEAALSLRTSLDAGMDGVAAAMGPPPETAVIWRAAVEAADGVGALRPLLYALQRASVRALEQQWSAQASESVDRTDEKALTAKRARQSVRAALRPWAVGWSRRLDISRTCPQLTLRAAELGAALRVTDELCHGMPLQVPLRDQDGEPTHDWRIAHVAAVYPDGSYSVREGGVGASGGSGGGCAEPDKEIAWIDPIVSLHSPPAGQPRRAAHFLGPFPPPESTEGVRMMKKEWQRAPPPPPPRKRTSGASYAEDDDDDDDEMGEVGADGAGGEAAGGAPIEEEMCRHCGRSDHAEAMLLCDGCNQGYHIHCLNPPLRRVPRGDWFCFKCERANRKRRRADDRYDDDGGGGRSSRTVGAHRPKRSSVDYQGGRWKDEDDEEEGGGGGGGVAVRARRATRADVDYAPRADAPPAKRERRLRGGRGVVEDDSDGSSD